MADQAPLYAPGHDLARRYHVVRAFTDALSASLQPEDQCVQSMPDASPTKWHRAHTTWFFEQFVLLPHRADYQIFDPSFSYLFNSYYEAVGKRHPRPHRGLLTRPDTAAVGRYRAHVDQAMQGLLEQDALLHLPERARQDVAALVVLGLHHEQQHQELLVTDILHAFAQNPLWPASLPGWVEPAGAGGPLRFVPCRGGIAGVGAQDSGFCFDNETPRHQVLLQPYALCNRLVRNGEWQAFMDDGGYQRAGLWMAEGWDIVQREDWQAPLYWRRCGAQWRQFGPGGMADLDDDLPVRHVSWYEADAYARWAGARLPTEAELEAGHANVAEFTGHCWQWTSSAYGPYPGFRPVGGAVGEYNGKFMINQMVLRGGSMATPPGHTRPSYRNFFHPDKRWQFTGVRLARDL
jgi:ergothioneine biosynthesis protein EgtB